VLPPLLSLAVTETVSMELPALGSVSVTVARLARTAVNPP
jgi:hypothetical protein